MRIGVDATCWANGRGYGRYARELLRAMVSLAPDDQFVFFLDDHAALTLDLQDSNVKVVLVPQRVSPTVAAAADGSRSPADMLRFSRAVWREPLDVFFSPSVYSYFPLPPRLAAVITIHDAIAERFPELTLPSPRAQLFWRMKVALAVKQARLVLTSSNYSRREVAEWLNFPAARIRVAAAAPASAFRPSESDGQIVSAAGRLGLPTGARWFTYVGGFNPHKNVDVIVRAHARIAAECAPGAAPYLLLVGATTGDVFHGDHTRIRNAISLGGTDMLVRWSGWVADEELRHLLTGTVALLLPSECEGFGLPAVEAAACGTPVIATVASPLPELLAGGGIFVEPRDEDALTDAMRALLDRGTRCALGMRALERAQDLTWERGAASALGALREAAA